MTHLDIDLAHRFGNQHFNRLTQQLLSAVAEQQLGLTVDHYDLPFLIEKQKSIRRGFDHITEALFVTLALLQVYEIEQVVNGLVALETGQTERNRYGSAIFPQGLALLLIGVQQIPVRRLLES